MICVDASLAAKWIFPEPYSQEARALYNATLQNGERVVAPPLLPVEVTNIIRQHMRRAKPPRLQALTLAEANSTLAHFLSFPIELSMPRGLHERALTVAATHGLPAVYDAHYVALAQLLSCPLWTADERLANALSGQLPFVRWIGQT